MHGRVDARARETDAGDLSGGAVNGGTGNGFIGGKAAATGLRAATGCFCSFLGCHSAGSRYDRILYGIGVMCSCRSRLN